MITSDINKNLKSVLETDLPAPHVIKHNIPEWEADITLLTGKKDDFINASTFWISAMNYYAKQELTKAGGQDWYLLYGEKWITNVECKPITTNELLEIVKTCSEGADGFEFKYNIVTQTLMRDEWNDKVILFETETEFGIFYWETGA